jgi:hypothetical protein
MEEEKLTWWDFTTVEAAQEYQVNTRTRSEDLQNSHECVYTIREGVSYYEDYQRV